jgi:hypothetical protein
MPGIARVPLGTPRRLRTSSATTSASAPARSAFRAFCLKKQWPRSTSGISPSFSPAKSAAAQPDPERRSRPVALPEPE